MPPSSQGAGNEGTVHDGVDSLDGRVVKRPPRVRERGDHSPFSPVESCQGYCGVSPVDQTPDVVQPVLGLFGLVSVHFGYLMEDGRIPKDILYGELASGRRTKGRPQLRYKDDCKRDMKTLDINAESWKDLAADLMMWRNTLNQHLKSGEEKLLNAIVGKRAVRKERNNFSTPETTHKWDF